jgi:hypothetical protein
LGVVGVENKDTLGERKAEVSARFNVPCHRSEVAPPVSVGAARVSSLYPGNLIGLF